MRPPARSGPLDVVVASAGQISSSTAMADDPDEFARNVHVNLLGSQRLLARLGPAMVERRPGDVVLVTSTSSSTPHPHGRLRRRQVRPRGLNRAMQMELEGTGVRVGMVRPGRRAPSRARTGTGHRPAHHPGLGALGPAAPQRPAPHNVADAIVAMVSAPKGTHLSLIEVQPEAPVVPDRSHR
ncbi:MAG: SDR family NAD(P)-dependent oxidoreductase [Acidimicrobiales bacterium]